MIYQYKTAEYADDSNIIIMVMIKLQLFIENPPQSYGESPAITLHYITNFHNFKRDHTVNLCDPV